MRRFEIVKTLICEKQNSQIIPLNSRNTFQRVKLTRIYELLIVLRILLTFNVQTGWIHQDEFTNSLEVIAGDYFNLQVFKTSTFNTTFPTRSIFFLHSTIYFPYLCTSFHVINTEHPLGRETIPDAPLLILVPRLFYVFLSFIVDFVLYKFCKLQSVRFAKSKNNNRESDDDEEQDEEDDEHKVTSSTDIEDEYNNNNDHSIRLVTFASSQIILIFCSRTHSSSLSLLFYSILLYLVSHSMYVMEDYLPILDKYNKIDTRVDPIRKIKTGRELKALGYSPIQHLHWITLLIVAGMFNDPDFFLSYGCVPLFFYLQRGISHPQIGMTHFHARIFTFLAYFVAFCIPFILWDSFYYGKVTLLNFYNLNLSINSFVVTPVNYFVRKMVYLRDFPTFVKVLLNFLFLFNILGVMGLTSIAKELYDVCTKDWKDKPKLDSQWVFLNCSWFIPLAVLIQYKSAFDLGPLIFPLVYMHGHKIPLISRFSNKIGLTWFGVNIIGLLYWGYLNQGGILTSFLDFYNNLLPIRYNSTHVDIILSQISAIPPTFVLALPMKWKTFLSVYESAHSYSESISSSSASLIHWSEQYQHKHFTEIPKIVLKMEDCPKIRVLHTGNSPLPLYLLENELIRLVNTKQVGPFDQKLNFLVLPSRLRSDLRNNFKLLNMTHVKTYWTHLLLDWTIPNPNTMSRIPTFINNFKYYNIPNMTYGLDLYHFVEKSTLKTKNQMLVESNKNELVDSLFHKTEEEYFSYIVQYFAIFLTIFLFIMSYITFLL